MLCLCTEHTSQARVAGVVVNIRQCIVRSAKLIHEHRKNACKHNVFTLANIQAGGYGRAKAMKGKHAIMCGNEDSLRLTSSQSNSSKMTAVPTCR